MKGRRHIQAIPAGTVPAHRRWYCDPWLAGAALCLLGLGLVMVASASISLADRELGRPLHYFWRQLAFVTIGVALAGAALQIPAALWQRHGALLLVLGMLGLVLVLVPGVGREVNGSMRWIKFGPVNFQPSELMKLLLIVYLAGYLVRRSEEVRNVITGFFKPIAVLILIAMLLLLEPDYGATVVIFAAALAMLFLGGVPMASFAAWACVIVAALGSIILAAPYRMQRLAVFLDPWADPFGSGFQLTQALIAIGRGEWLGVGLGNSVQKLFYLPEAHTDFLFAVLAEELGFAGVAAVVLLFSFLVWRAFDIGRRAERAGRPFGVYLAQGIGIAIGLQAFINVGVNMGVLPTKGLTLPLMSHGGSSVIVNCLAVGLLLRIDREARLALGGGKNVERSPAHKQRRAAPGIKEAA